jgi:hypothetical protein
VPRRARALHSHQGRRTARARALDAPAGARSDNRSAENVFALAGNTRELATVTGVTPPVHFHALVAECGQRIARFREFVVFRKRRQRWNPHPHNAHLSRFSRGVLRWVRALRLVSPARFSLWSRRRICVPGAVGRLPAHRRGWARCWVNGSCKRDTGAHPAR